MIVFPRGLKRRGLLARTEGTASAMAGRAGHPAVFEPQGPVGAVSAHRAGVRFGLTVVAVSLVGLALRTLGLHKVDGLWYDELLSLAIARQAFPDGILRWLSEQCFHAPLYYFYLHVIDHMAGGNETCLRLSSVVFGVASLPMIAITGEALGVRRAGLYAGVLAAVNSALIYYSQEVRFYGWLTFLVALGLWLTLRVVQTGGRGACWGLAVCHLLLLYTYLLGALYVGMQLAVASGCLLASGRRDTLRRLALSQATLLALYLPYVPTLLHIVRDSNRSLVGDFWWVRMGPASPLLALQDWFSPILVNLRGHPTNYYRDVFASGVDLALVGLIAIPLGIGLAGAVSALRRPGPARVMLLAGLAYFAVSMLLAAAGKFGPLTRHTLIALPAVLTAVGAGLAGLRPRWLSAGTLGLYTALCLGYLLFGHASASWAPRDGYRKYAAAIAAWNPTPADVILIPYGARAFAWYGVTPHARIARFDVEALFVDGQGLEAVFDAATIAALTGDSEANKTVLRGYLGAPVPAAGLQRYFREELAGRLGTGGRLFYVVSGQINPFDAADLERITRDDVSYRRVPLYLLLSSKVLYDLFQLCHEVLEPVDRRLFPGWQLHVFRQKDASVPDPQPTTGGVSS